MAEVHINGLAFILYDDIALMKWLDTYMAKYMQAQQEAEDQGKKEFICPDCGGMAWWSRCEENHHLYTECSICGIAIYDLSTENVCKAIGQKTLFGHHSGKKIRSFWARFMKFRKTNRED